MPLLKRSIRNSNLLRRERHHAYATLSSSGNRYLLPNAVIRHCSGPAIENRSLSEFRALSMHRGSVPARTHLAISSCSKIFLDAALAI